jgi:pimeloyl-[acyl-carrier protein] methyl ester esterase
MPSSKETGIVLLPGMDGTGEFLKPLAEQLSRHRQVLVVDYPTDRVQNYDELVSHVRERLPDDRAIVLGESFSGPIAIEVAAADPRVVGLVLASSFSRHPLPTQLAPLTRLFDHRWMPISVVIAALVGAAATPKLREHLRDVLVDLPREIIQARVREVLRVDKRKRLSETRCPMLCLHGRKDRLVRKRHVDDIVAARPDCEVYWLDGPHMLLATHTYAAARAIEEFCRRLN